MNRLFLLLFGMVTFVAHAQVPDYVPTEGLVGWYPLDGDGQDIGPLGLQGTTLGTECGADRFAQSCGAVTFTDGDRIVIETDSSNSSAELTVCFWTKLDHHQSYNHFFNRWEGSDYEFVMSSNSTGLYIYVGNTLFLSDHLPSLDEWHHLTFWYSTATGSAGILEDGVSVAEFTGVPETPATNYPMHIGGTPDGSSYNSVNGEMDDLGIWNRALTEEEILALYNAPAPVTGCTDPTACNFDAEATWSDDTCEYGCFSCGSGTVWNDSLGQCLPSAGVCLDGTIWDAELGGCVPTDASCPQDLDFDGVVGVNDLMDLLSAFGTDCAPAEEPETSEFTCGNPVHFYGYDYSTVEIGDQCWFAENLRTEHYTNGDAIPANLSDGEWGSTTSGALTVYGEDTGCTNYSPDGDACDPTWSLNEYGRLYNWYAVDDARGLCPTGWHVPTDGEWMTLEMELGMSESDANSTGWRGTDQGAQMKTTYGWSDGGNGTNSSGFSGLPGGFRNTYGNFGDAGNDGDWWSSSPSGSNAWARFLNVVSPGVFRYYSSLRLGISVRCLRDAE